MTCALPPLRAILRCCLLQRALTLASAPSWPGWVPCCGCSWPLRCRCARTGAGHACDAHKAVAGEQLACQCYQGTLPRYPIAACQRCRFLIPMTPQLPSHPQLENGLSTIDALLGCPIVLFEPSLATDGSAWASLPGPSRLAALGALFHTVAWLRETVNGFAPQASTCHSSAHGVAVVLQEARRPSRSSEMYSI